MCGIIAQLGTGDVTPAIFSSLENLEYRGYDSAGIAVQNGHGIDVRKTAGTVSELAPQLHDLSHGNVGIGHTRWATHGPPTDENAHPHTDDAGNIAVVHNGVITNQEALRDELSSEGIVFKSETDTEVIPHLMNKYGERTGTWENAFLKTVNRLEGSFAIAVIVHGEEVVFGARQGSPLILGIGRNEWYLASDVPAFLEYTDRVVYLEDGDVVVVRPDNYRVFSQDGTSVSREVERVEWDPEDAEKGEYAHYMLKEIHSQPHTIANTYDGRITDSDITFSELSEGLFTDIEDVQFVGCGTSYHACMYGAQVLRQLGVPANAVLASEFDNAAWPIDRSLVVAVTQSGETADTLDALRTARGRGALTIAVTNVVGSTADREADSSIQLRAGPEIGVAATKTYSSQVIALVLLAQRITGDIPGVSPAKDLPQLLDSLRELPEHITSVIETSTAPQLANKYVDKDAFFFIGRGLGYSVALEGALKFKEITYLHAEGFPSGELKHGPLALVTGQTPIVAVYPGGDDEKTQINASEAKCRDAPVVGVGPSSHTGVESADDQLTIPNTHPVWGGLLANIQLQLLAYHAADILGRSIDKPRNLAKSVTVV